MVRDLVTQGWHVEAEDRLYRALRRISFQVASGIDWFELRGDVQFDGAEAPLPRLLAALRSGSDMVRLDDGTCGVLPEQWLGVRLTGGRRHPPQGASALLPQPASWRCWMHAGRPSGCPGSPLNRSYNRQGRVLDTKLLP
jgi:hypothetical protein